ncbi:MAG TPA: bifunctional phosphoribosyl-AMP cyclohydrolase/phosphoribosyl-ATP diphosphatase HisIE [Candidatus Aphodousia faecigallinarum]|uniref:Histidine biosynthesis bifunctional protein HisIE n=1 Tax=Candidatus Aphodousia faecigallinarum TaxID=2840677 RepID=A0A9D1IHD4_9BURK|nr:bifunctional phosphoribosyl-AMP cyclohydrolase/phosphoribosyl-ATP diphosphatase HisIE [Candidatus Aphodousia faecigallinarum]
MLDAKELDALDFEKGDGLLPAIVQNAVSGRVLMLGYMNREALEKTIQTGKVTFWSRSKQRLWTKGETSENYLYFVDVAADCDRDALLVLANPQGPTCHLGRESCFGDMAPAHEFLAQLERILAERKNASTQSSYTASLYARGTKRIAQKVGEEAVETALAATVHAREETINEASDLVYHLLVLLQKENLDWATIVANLKKRHLAREK